MEKPVQDTPRGTVTAELNFVAPPPDGSEAYVNTGPYQGQQTGDMSVKETRLVRVEDIRGNEEAYFLDEHGFEILQNVSSDVNAAAFDNPDEIERLYYPEVQHLLMKNIQGAHHVKILGHGVRREGAPSARQPIHFVHADHTAQAAEEFARQCVEETGKPQWLQGRYRIFSVWRPLNGEVQSSPMAFTSATSLESCDIHSVQLRDSEQVSYFTGLRPNPKQRWLYCSGMQVTERLLLKCTDTATNVAKLAAHSAFKEPRTTGACRPRESIEVRALVFG